jgi:hypothetical protein
MSAIHEFMLHILDLIFNLLKLTDFITNPTARRVMGLNPHNFIVIHYTIAPTFRGCLKIKTVGRFAELSMLFFCKYNFGGNRRVGNGLKPFPTIKSPNLFRSCLKIKTVERFAELPKIKRQKEMHLVESAPR